MINFEGGDIVRKLFLTVAMVMAFSTVAFASTTPDTYGQISTASIDTYGQISTASTDTYGQISTANIDTYGQISTASIDFTTNCSQVSTCK